MPRAEKIFDYTVAVRQAYDDFPDIRDKVFFVDALTFRTLHPSRQLNLSAEDVRLAMQIQASKRACYASWLKHGYFYTGDDVTPILGAASLYKTHRFIFNHELAHAAIPEASNTNKRLIQENIADVYATLQHLKADINDLAPLQHLIALRAAEMICIGDKNKIRHFTAPLLEKVIDARYTYKLSGKTSAEIAKLAHRIVMDARPSMTIAQRIAARFHATQRAARAQHAANSDVRTPVQILAETVMQAHGPLTFKWGAVTLMHVFNKQARLPQMGVDQLSQQEIRAIKRALWHKQQNFRAGS